MTESRWAVPFVIPSHKTHTHTRYFIDCFAQWEMLNVIIKLAKQTRWFSMALERGLCLLYQPTGKLQRQPLWVSQCSRGWPDCKYPGRVQNTVIQNWLPRRCHIISNRTPPRGLTWNHIRYFHILPTYGKRRQFLSTPTWNHVPLFQFITCCAPNMCMHTRTHKDSVDKACLY